MKTKIFSLFLFALMLALTSSSSCEDTSVNTSAVKEQSQTEVNQTQLSQRQELHGALKEIILLNASSFKTTGRLHFSCMFLSKEYLSLLVITR